jgi:hypothetical protein
MCCPMCLELINYLVQIDLLLTLFIAIDLQKDLQMFIAIDLQKDLQMFIAIIPQITLLDYFMVNLSSELALQRVHHLSKAASFAGQNLEYFAFVAILQTNHLLLVHLRFDFDSQKVHCSYLQSEHLSYCHQIVILQIHDANQNFTYLVTTSFGCLQRDRH